jgi:hypothetical protein
VATLDLYALRLLEAKLEEEKQGRAEAILNGLAQTLEEYKNHIGYIQGLRDAIIWAKEINDQLIGRDDKAR